MTTSLAATRPVLQAWFVDDASVLAGVPLFAGLSRDALAELGSSLELREVHAGTEIMREGESGDSMHVVLSGRVEVFVGGEHVRTHGRGEAFGELALLGDRTRTATVTAVRDTQLWTLSSTTFDRLIATEPTFTRALIASLARLARKAAAPAPRSTSGAVVGVVAGHADLPADAVDVLATELAAEPDAVLLSPPASPAQWPHALEAAEHDRPWVILAAPLEGPWRDFVLRQADRVLAVVRSDERPRPAPVSARGLELVLLAAGRAGNWIDAWQPVRTHIVTSQADRARVVRRVYGRATGIVFSGGGARGFAHLGVLQVLEEAGVVVDRFGGTSMGACVAALAACLGNADEAVAMARSQLTGRNVFRDYVWPKHSLIKGERARIALERIFGSACIEDLHTPFFCMSTDLIAAEEVVHRRGPIANAVGRSMSIPGVAPPRPDAARLLVDGGVLNNLPVDVMAEEGEGPVIAVDVMRRFRHEPDPQVVGPKLPGIVDVIGRSMVLGSWRKSEAARQRAELVISPGLDDVGMFDFGALDVIVAEGRRAAERALAESAWSSKP